jgi:ABC-type multidrug transport system fused ATPase/permease subunit
MHMTTLEPALTFDFRKTLQQNRIKGLWQMMADYRLPYLGATLALAFSALAKTFTYLLLRYFADNVLTNGETIGGSLTQTFIWIAVGFVGLASASRQVHGRYLSELCKVSPRSESG